jgi:hypothetical protein
MLFELSDQVRQNILALIGKVDIKGSEWRAIAEIEQVLNNPVKDDKSPPKQPPAPENETITKGKKQP